jgi:hypothetical protein
MSSRPIFAIICINLLLAISVNHTWASCLKPPATPQTIVQFRLAPLELVAPNADTRTIEATTRDIAGTDASLATELVRIAQGTNPRFQAAIAAGLALAAISCSTVDQQAAQQIQQAVASFQDGQFQSSFAAVSGDLSTAASVAATSSVSSSAGSVTVINPNQSKPTTINRGGGGGAAALILLATPGQTFGTNGFTTSNTASTITAEPVSPTR